MVVFLQTRPVVLHSSLTVVFWTTLPLNTFRVLIGLFLFSVDYSGYIMQRLPECLLIPSLIAVGVYMHFTREMPSMNNNEINQIFLFSFYCTVS